MEPQISTYGATKDDRKPLAEKDVSLQRDVFNHNTKFHCCSGERIDSFRLIVISLFVFAGGVTVALIIQIAAGIATENTSKSSTAEGVVSDSDSCSAIGDKILRRGKHSI